MAKTTGKSFRCEEWLAVAIHKQAHSLDITDSEWISRTLMARLVELGAFDSTDDSKQNDTRNLH